MPPSTRVKHHLPSEFHQRPTLVAGNSARVRLKETEHFFSGGNLFALQDPAPCLFDHLGDQGQDLLDLTMESLRFRGALLAQRCHDARGLSHHLLSRLHQFLVQVLLLCLLLLSLAP